MFKFTVKYLTSFGAMTIHDNEFNCRSCTKVGAWRKFLKATKNEDFYEDESFINSFWKKRKDIKFCGV